jgi:hypothetical protein
VKSRRTQIRVAKPTKRWMIWSAIVPTTELVSPRREARSGKLRRSCRFLGTNLIPAPRKAAINAKRCSQTRYADDDPAAGVTQSMRFRRRLHGQCGQKSQHQWKHQRIQHFDCRVEVNQIRQRGGNDCAADDCGGVDGIEPGCFERATLKEVLATGNRIPRRGRETTIAAIIAAPIVPKPKIRRPMEGPRNGVSAVALSPTESSRSAEAAPVVPMVAAVAISTAAMTICVTTASSPVSHRTLR